MIDFQSLIRAYTPINFFFFLNDTPTPEIYPLPLPDALPISPPASTINAGDMTSYTLTVTPVAGFKQTVNLSCTGFPAASTCDITPPAVTLDGTNAATATITVKTTARASSPPFLVVPPVASPAPRWEIIAFLFAWIATLLMLWNSRQAFGRQSWAPLRLAGDRKSTRLNSSHLVISYAVF